MSDFFISYARHDKPFVKELCAALAAENREVWIDWEDIPPTATWLTEIEAGIERADAFVFIITPASISSVTCQKELAHAVLHNKRLVPLLHVEAEAGSMPDALASRNWIFLRKSDDFAAGYRSLIAAIDTDLDWVRAHTRLLVRALEWERAARDASLTLRGRDLQQAEQWLGRGAQMSPAPTALQSEYVLTSRRAQSRRQRTLVASLVAGLCITVVLAIAAFLQRREAVAQTVVAEERRQQADRERDLATAREIASSAVSQLANDPQLSLLLSLEANRRAPTAEAEDALRQSVLQSMLRPSASELEGVAWLETSPGARVVSPDGRVAATRHGDWIVLELLEQRSTNVILTNGQFLRAEYNPLTEYLGFSDDSSLLRTITDGRPVERAWRVEPTIREHRLTGHTAPVTSVSFNRDGSLILSADQSGSTRLWRRRDGTLVGQVAGYAAVFSADGNRLAVAAASAVTLYDAASLSPGITLAGHTGRISTVTFSHDGSRVLTAGADGTARIWNAATGEAIHLLSVSSRPVYTAAFNRSDTAIVTAADDGQARVWEAATGSPLLSLAHRPGMLRAVFSADGTSILTVRDAGAVAVWNAATGAAHGARTHKDEGARATLSPDGQMVVSASEAAEPPAVWNSRDGELLSTLSKTGGGIVSQFAFSPNGRCVASGGQGNTLTVSEPRTGRAFFQSHRFTDGIRALAFEPDGRSMVVGSGDGAVQVFRADICGDLPGLLDLAGHRVARVLTAEERATYLHETAANLAIPR